MFDFIGVAIGILFAILIISGVIYLLMVPISSMHYLMIKKNVKAIADDTDHHEDVL